MEGVYYAIKSLESKKKEVLDVKRDIKAIIIEDVFMDQECQQSLIEIDKKITELQIAINILNSKELL